jgi:hypothetical protein
LTSDESSVVKERQAALFAVGIVVVRGLIIPTSEGSPRSPSSLLNYLSYPVPISNLGPSSASNKNIELNEGVVPNKIERISEC